MQAMAAESTQDSGWEERRPGGGGGGGGGAKPLWPGGLSLAFGHGYLCCLWALKLHDMSEFMLVSKITAQIAQSRLYITLS